jgi:hypothetical protein
MIVCCNPASVRWSCSLIAGFCITASQLIKKHATMHTLRAAEHKAPSSIIGSANECTNRYRCQAAGLQLHTGNKNESPVGKTATGFSKFEFNDSHIAQTLHSRRSACASCCCITAVIPATGCTHLKSEQLASFVQENALALKGEGSSLARARKLAAKLLN